MSFVPCPSVPIPKRPSRRRGSSGLPGGVSLASVPQERLSGVPLPTQISLHPGAPELRPAGGRMGANRQARPVGAPQSLGMPFPAFPWKEPVCVVGPGTAAPPALPGGSLSHGSASLGATPGISALASSPEARFYRLEFKPAFMNLNDFYEEGTHLRAPHGELRPHLVLAPSYCTGYF